MKLISGRYVFYVLLISVWSYSLYFLLSLNSLFHRVSCPQQITNNHSNIQVSSQSSKAATRSVPPTGTETETPHGAFYSPLNSKGQDADAFSDPAASSHPEQTRVVWIGGQGRSGTTLVRAMLDAHPALNCGPETVIMPELIGNYQVLLEVLRRQNEIETREIGIRALRAFIYQLLRQRADGAQVLCSKEPFNMRYGLLLDEMFPNSKFVFVIRDGRAVCRNPFARQSDNVRAEATRNFLNNLLDWNNGARLAWEACVRLGVWREPNLFNASTVRTLSPRGGSESRGNRCFPLYYELLVQRPELWMRSLFRFLELPFDARVLRHHEHIGRPGGVRLSDAEPRTNQVQMPIYQDVVASWPGVLLDLVPDALSMAREKALMIGVFGYAHGIEDTADNYTRLSLYYDTLMNIWSKSSAKLENVEKALAEFKNSTASRL